MTATFAARDLRRMLPGSQRAHVELVRACCLLLEFRGLPAVPLSTTGVPVRRRSDGAFELRPNRGQVGISDILSAVPGHGLLIECKTGRAHRTQAQIRRQKQFQALGFLCPVIRDVADLERLLQPYPRSR